LAALDVRLQNRSRRVGRVIVAYHVEAFDADKAMILDPLTKVSELILEYTAGSKVIHTHVRVSRGLGIQLRRDASRRCFCSFRLSLKVGAA
jgi:hypothetical protein